MRRSLARLEKLDEVEAISSWIRAETED